MRFWVFPNIPVITSIHSGNKKYLDDKKEHFNSLNAKQTPEIVLDNIRENKRIAIVYSSWHPQYITQIRDKLKTYLNEYDIKDISEYEVPGSNEIPFVASKIAKNVDGILCVGILIKGDTLHFENVSGAVSNGIMQAQIASGVPMMNVILSCLNFEQVEERICGEKSTLEYIVKGLLSLLN